MSNGTPVTHKPKRKRTEKRARGQLLAGLERRNEQRQTHLLSHLRQNDDN